MPELQTPNSLNSNLKKVTVKEIEDFILADKISEEDRPMWIEWVESAGIAGGNFINEIRNARLKSL